MEHIFVYVYIYIYIYADENSFMLQLYLRHDFYNLIFKIKGKS